MKRIIHITAKSETAPAAGPRLCELSPTHLALAQLAGKERVQTASYFECKDGLVPLDLEAILGGAPAPADAPLSVANAAPDCLLIPAPFFTEENAVALFENTFGRAGGALLHDELEALGLVLTHALHADVIDILKTASATQPQHIYSCLLRRLSITETSSFALVDFAAFDVRVLLFNEGRFLAAQTYRYAAPLDVVYYLLALYNQFHLSQPKTELVVSGLISDGSAMLKELHQYFGNLRFQTVPEGWLPDGEYPGYTFASLYNLSRCAL